ncbi:MAG: dihydroorotate dehydrogenase electron transfer subunit [Candidatus Omnitrophota bacterium]
MGKIYQEKVKIVSNSKIKNNYFKMVLEPKNISINAKPGQFLELMVSDQFDPLLRRPFSIHRIENKKITILYEVLGRGTQILLQRKSGEYLDVIGPLGNGFNIESKIKNQKSKIILVAGGMGVAPLVFLAERLAKLKTQNSKLKTLVLIGAKTKNHLLCEKEFKNFGCEVQISTDDGSMGFKGKATDLLKNLLRATSDERRTTVFACGPKPMLKEIAIISEKYDIKAQISLEAYMACGFGACLGCVAKTREGYKMVCSDGPVFEAKEILWE